MPPGHALAATMLLSPSSFPQINAVLEGETGPNVPPFSLKPVKTSDPLTLTPPRKSFPPPPPTRTHSQSGVAACVCASEDPASYHESLYGVHKEMLIAA